jgi:hypothetical protein
MLFAYKEEMKEISKRLGERVSAESSLMSELNACKESSIPLKFEITSMKQQQEVKSKRILFFFSRSP